MAKTNIALACIALLFAEACKDNPPPGNASADAGTGANADAHANANAGADANANANANADAGANANANARADADASADSGTATASTGPYNLDAGPSACRLLSGPQKMVFVGPAALKVEGGDLDVLTNDSGKPRVLKIPIPPIPPPNARPAEPPRPPATYGVTWPPCAFAGAYAVCPGRAGAITRTELPNGFTKEIVKGRPGTRIAAAAVGAGGRHTVTAFLDEKQTTEGRMLQAFAVLDDNDPVRLSDDGSGATGIDLASRGNSALALVLDARTAMVPVHARTVGEKDGKLDLGKDVVVDVGGAPERGIAGHIAVSPARTLFLVPMSEDALSFGMSTILLSDPPKEQEPKRFSLYPNGLDPAPLATTRGTSPIRVARVRPLDKNPGSQRALELGALADDGTFTSHGIIVVGKNISDLDIAVDSFGATWVLYGDAADTWLERRQCP